MKLLLLCFILTISIVVIWDYYNAPQEILDLLLSLLTKKKFNHFNLVKPFSCSKCMTFWTTLILLLILSPEYFYLSLLFSWSTQYIIIIIDIIDKLMTLLLGSIQTLLQKLINKL